MTGLEAHILIIDDEKSIRDSFRNFLEDCEYRVTTANNGIQGLEKFNQSSPDLVLLDLRMPELDGLEVLKKIQIISPSTPTIVISGTGIIGDAIEALRFGASDYLLKPICDLSILEHSVRKAFDRLRLVHENKRYQEQLEAKVASRTKELEHANAKLQKSEEMARALLNATTDAVILLDVNDRILDVNETFANLLAQKKDKIFGSNLWELLPKEVREELSSQVNEVRKTRLPIHTIFKWLDRWNDTVIFPVIEDDSNVARVAVFARDITEHKLTQELLYRQNQALERSMDGIVIVNLDDTIQFVNSAWAEMHGYSPEDLRGKQYSIFHTSEQIDMQVAQFMEKTRIHGRHEAEIEHVNKDGSVFPTRMSSTLLFNDDRAPVATICVIHDISERLELEAQLRQSQKMESIGRLAGGVAHDFNNLLSPILGYSEILLLDFSPKDPRFDDLLEIKKAADRAKDLTRQLLAFGRKQVLEMKTIKFAKVVAGFETILRRTIREDINLQTHIEGSIGAVRADVSQLEQILMNLVVNAQDAMPSGGKMIIEVVDVVLNEEHVEPHPGANPGPYVMLAVHDTGTGIAKDTLKHVFEPFFTTKEQGKGTGLGLAMVYGIVKQHNAFISVSSELGEGTTFALYFPRIDEAAESSPAPPVQPTAQAGDETVLVVEDDTMVRHLVCSILIKYGYNVIEATDIDDCFRKIEQAESQIHLLLTDVVMPVMNGRQLYEKLEPVVPGLRVLYMSGYTDDVIVHHGVLEDGVDFIQKPISVPALTTKIREVLDRDPEDSQY